jgi:hypothetical protein
MLREPLHVTSAEKPKPGDPDWEPPLKGFHRLWGSVCVVMGVLLLAAAGLALAGLPTELREERAFLAAETCTDPNADSRGCLWTFPATVVETDRNASRSGATYDIALESAIGWSGVVRGFGSKPLAARLEPGDSVTVSTWWGEVVSIGRGDVTQRAPGGPDYGPQIFVVLAMMAGVLGGWSLFAGLRAVRWAGRIAERGVRSALPPLLLPVLTTLFLPAIPALFTRNGQGAAPVIATLAVGVTLNALALLLLRRRLSSGPAEG